MVIRRKWFWFKVCSRTVAGLILLLILIAGGVLLWLNTEAGNASITRMINHRIPGEVRFDSLELSIQDGIQLGGVNYSWQGDDLHISSRIEELGAIDLLWGVAKAVVREGTLSLNGEPVVFARRMDLQFDSFRTFRPERFVFIDGWVDLDSLETLRPSPDQPVSATPEPSAPPAESPLLQMPAFVVAVDDIRVRSMRLPMQPRWDGEVRIEENGRTIGYDLQGERSEGVTDSERLSLRGEIDLEDIQSLQLDAQAQSFPLAFERPEWLSAQVNGALRTRPEGDGLLYTTTDVELSAIDIVLSPTSHIAADWALARAQITTASSQTLRQATATVPHATVTWIDPGRKRWRVPGGELAATVQVLSATRAETRAVWHSDDIGRATFQASRWPLSGTSPWRGDFSLKPVGFRQLAAFLPDTVRSFLHRLGGTLSASGQVQRTPGSIGLNAVAGLQQGALALGPVELESVSLDAQLAGDADGLHGQLLGQADIHMVLDNERVYSLAPVSLGGEFHLTYADAGWTLTLHAEEAEPFADMQFSLNETLDWSLDADLNLEQGTAELVQAFIPWLERSFEGSGTASIQVRSRNGVITTEINSPDVVAYSFAEEPSMGAQLRDVVTEVTVQPVEEDRLAVQASLQAATPYVSYDGRDYEWPGGLITGTFTRPFLDEPDWSLSLQPPGGGELTLDHTGERWDGTADGLNLEELVVPLLQSFVLQDDPDESFWGASGRMNGSLSWSEIDAVSNWRGIATLTDVIGDYHPEPGAQIRGASITLPFSFPPSFEHLPEKSIHFAADSVTIKNVTYPNPRFSIPITANDISYATPWSLTLYGGLLQMRNLAVRNWQSGTVAIEGEVAVETMDLQRAHQFLPFLPYPGTVSGQMSLGQVSADVIHATGNLVADVFDGNISIQHIGIFNPLEGQREFELDAEFDRVDLQRLIEFFEFGEMTGQVNGYVRNLRIQSPSASGSDWVRPLSFDILLETQSKGNWMVSRSTLENIVNLGEQSDLTRLVVERERYLFTEMGLRARLERNNMRLYGTLRDNFFLASDITKGIEQLFKPSEWFQIPINIKLAQPDEVIPFDRVWQRLKDQAG